MDKKLIRSKYDYTDKLNELKSKINYLKKTITLYEETITNISDIKPDTKVNVIARIVRIPTVRSYEKNGKEGKWS